MKQGIITATVVITILCPLPNRCQRKWIIYQANIDCDTLDINKKCYLGSCETTFKDGFGNHKTSLNHIKHKNDTELSKEFWEIKKHNRTPEITWKIIKHAFLQCKQ